MILGADFNLETAVPQDANLNRGAYRQMENELAQALDSGKSVKVDVQIGYSGADTRPATFKVQANIDGREQTWVFKNAPRGR
jgi:filamentous hemagglutinin